MSISSFFLVSSPAFSTTYKKRWFSRKKLRCYIERIMLMEEMILGRFLRDSDYGSQQEWMRKISVVRGGKRREISREMEEKERENER